MPQLHTSSAVRLLLAGLAAVLVLAACGEDATVGPPDEDVTPTVEPTPTPTPTPTPPPDEPSPPADDPATEDPADEVEPLAGDPSTEEQRVDAGPGQVAVVDVRVATHDGFDRVVIDIEGDGAAGWWVHYVDEARTAGKGDVIELDGDAVLSVAIQGATLPPELPDDIDPWVNESRAGAGGVVTEVAGDTVFEGVHGIFIGLDKERPYVIERLDDPQRIVVDILHD